MRKYISGLVLSAAFIGLALGNTIYAKENRQDEDNYIQEQDMSLIQDGEVLIPEVDYSFFEESLTSYLEAETSSDDELRAAALETRGNVALEERQKACAEALYSAMTGFEETVNVSSYALTKEEFKNTISDLVNSNPELFYIGQTYGVTTIDLNDESNSKIVKMCMGFYECQSPVRETRNVNGEQKEVTVGYTEIDTELINEQKKLLDSRKNEILNETLTEEMSDACKVLLIHDYLALNIKYDYSAYLENKKNNTSKYAESDYDIYGALIDGQAVCQGYTLAFKYLLEAAGVSNVGFACTSDHIWNTILIDGEGYNVDCTWDDPSWDTLGNVKHKYLLKGKEDFTGHSIATKTDFECNGDKFADYFWNDINSGIFYHKGKLYYMNTDGKLCIRDGIENDADVKVTDLSLEMNDDWNYINAVKLALVDKYAVYHDEKNLYAYDYKDGRTEVLYSPETEEEELIYGLAANNNVLSYATRNAVQVAENDITEQTIYAYQLPEDPFNIPIESVSITGEDTLYIRMVNGSFVYDKASYKAVISPTDATNQKIMSWVSSDTKILTIDLNGAAKAVAPGEVTITVTTKEGPKAVKTVRVAYEGDIVSDDGTVLHYVDGNLLADQFFTENGKQYYLGSDGKPVKGLNNIGGSTYYFDNNGVMLIGWQTINDGKYYFNSKGIMQKNCFLNDNGKRYFLNDTGKMLMGLIAINGRIYYFDNNGVMLTGWQTIDGGVHYFNSDGVMLTGWQKINDKLYYFNENGVMLTGWQTIDGETKYFDADGVCLTVGWQIIDGNQYYFNMKGVPVTGWQNIDGKTYYFNEKGVMLTGWQKISKKTYYLDKKGVMQTGWKTIGKKKYYFSKKGVMQTGWKTIKKKKYYFNKKGVMQTGWKTIKGKKYYFTKKGVMLKGLQTIKGVSYYFAPDGHFVS